MILHPHKIIPLLDIQHGQTVLDMGSSIGFWVKPLSQIVGGTGKIIAVDNHTEIIQRLNHDAQELGLNNLDAITGDIHNLSDLPIKESSVDKLLLIRMVSLIESNLEQVVMKLLDFTKVDGQLIIIDGMHYKNDIISLLNSLSKIIQYREITDIDERTNHYFFGLVIEKVTA